jgi:hypothetical protein
MVIHDDWMIWGTLKLQPAPTGKGFVRTRQDKGPTN